MKPRTWVIIGATSIIAKYIAHCAAQSGNNIRLVGRDKTQLGIIAQDITLRFKIPCDFLVIDLTAPPQQLLAALSGEENELDLLIAQSDFTENEHLNEQSIIKLIETNIVASALLINHYLKLPQEQHNLLYLSSVAACRGRAKNSLYGGSKAAIEVYLQGLQQSASPTTQITIARLGFIDTRQTYGASGIFYAAPPQKCAKACWKALNKRKKLIFYPFFWRGIMGIITRLPLVVFKKMGSK
ncbi:MAG TPA: SDR family NAD(P)-dependent oxidoreductase [Legionella sp.]|nr:SDR family NAD(P)-dependent oxidoreductase [Legionella sp.]